MADPRITYLGGAADLDWLEPMSVGADGSFPHPPRQLIGQNTSHGALTETVRLAVYDEIPIMHKDFASRAFWRALVNFTSQAMAGNTFAFALDRDKRVNATIVTWGNPLRVTLAGGSTAILGSGGSPVEYKLMSADGLAWGIVQSTGASLVSGSTYDVTLVALPAFTFSAGDIFRDPYYWPKLIMQDPQRSPLTEHAGLIYGFEMRAREERG